MEEEESKPVTITMSGKVVFNDSISLHQAAQILAFIDNSSNMAFVSPARPTSPVVIDQRAIGTSSTPTGSPRDILESSGAKTNPEKIVALASHALQDGGRDTFTLDDIRPLFRRARESMPKNITRDLDVAIRNGWIDEADEKGEYWLTQKAYEAIDGGFESVSRTKNGSSKSKASTRKKATISVPEAFKDVVEIPGTLDGLPPYQKLSNNPDRYLWAVYVAKQLGINEVSNGDIAFITDRLGRGIAPNDINSYFRSNKGKGHVNKSLQTNKVRILDAGETYLKSLKSE